MLVLGIILAVLALLLLLPVGVYVSYLGGALTLAAKVGPFRIGILPKKPKPAGKEKEKKVKKKKEKKPKQEGEKAAKPRQKLTLDDIVTLLRLGLQALGRFRRHLKLDKLLLHLTVATPDPYDTAVRYGYINAALGSLLPLLHRAVKVGEEDIGTAMDFTDDRLRVDAQLEATIQIWEIFHILLCAGWGALRWWLDRKRRIKREQRAALAAEKGT